MNDSNDRFGIKKNIKKYLVLRNKFTIFAKVRYINLYRRTNILISKLNARFSDSALLQWGVSIGRYY